MTVDILKKIAHERPKGRALIGLDVGTKTIGVALCDPSHQVATPVETIKRTKFTKDIEHPKMLVEEYEVAGFVIGLPVNMDGSEGARAQSVRDFALELARYSEIVGDNPWIALHDERLSTVSVEEAVDNFVDKRKTRVESKESGLIDKLAAQHILQSAINFFI